jgi:hypothetical protein
MRTDLSSPKQQQRFLGQLIHTASTSNPQEIHKQSTSNPQALQRLWKTAAQEAKPMRRRKEQ